MSSSHSPDAVESPAPAAAWVERNRRGLLFGLLVLSLGLRWWLAGTGGEGYWPDEARYITATRSAVVYFSRGETHEGWSTLIGKADHLFFKVAGVPVAWWEMRHGQNPALVARYFGVFSVLGLGLIYGIARRAGAGAREALLAVFFAAGANSLFYYTRHLFPYDLSLFFCLLALWLALGEPAGGRSFSAGLAASLGFLSYNGYWLLAGAILTWHVLAARNVRAMLLRTAWAGAGLLIPIAAAVLAARGLGSDLIASFREFSGTITQGDFGRGHLFVWQYLWETEGVLLLAWAALALGGGSMRWKSELGRRLRFWLGAVVLLYLGLVVCADGLRIFVVYGRTARILVPFFCLAAAAASESIFWRSRCPRWIPVAVLIGMAAAAGGHMSRALRQVFPADFLVEAAQVARSTPANGRGLLRILNAERLGEGRAMEESQPHITLLQRKHPYEFRPYLYEGFSEAQRNQFARSNISMQLIARPDLAPTGFGAEPPAGWRLRVRFPGHQAGIGEPLLTGGTEGRANFLYVRYVDDRHVCFGYDVWGGPGLVSPPVELDYGAEHELVVVAGKIKSANERDEMAPQPADLLVVLDGKAILSERYLSNVVDPATVFVALNFVGGSSARTCFTGEILELHAVSPAEVEPLLAKGSLRGIRDATWADYPGTLRLQIGFAPDSRLLKAPLLTSGAPEATDTLFVTRDANGVTRLGFSHAPEPAIYSEPLSPPEWKNLVVSMGSCFPPLASSTEKVPLYPAWLGNRLVVLAGERKVLQWVGSFHPSAPDALKLGGSGLDFKDRATAAASVSLEGKKMEIEALPAAVARVEMADRAGEWRGYPGPLRLRLRFFPRPAGTNEPLLVTGVTGAGDFIFLRHLGGGRVQLGHDHWGVGVTFSEPTAAADGAEHELIVSLASLFPPNEDAPCYQLEPAWRRLREQRAVWLDGKILLGGAAPAHPSQPGEIYAGMNPIGGSSTDRFFYGEILSIERASAEAFRPVLAGEPAKEKN